MISGVDRARQSEDIEHILLDFAGKALQLGQLQFAQILFLLNGIRHRFAHHFVRIAERHSLFHQVIRQIGRGAIAFACGCQHILLFGAQCRHHVTVGFEAIFKRIDEVEQRFLVLLVILVVGQRLRLHQGEQSDQVTGYASCFTAYQFRHVRVLLLRHDR